VAEYKHLLKQLEDPDNAAATQPLRQFSMFTEDQQDHESANPDQPQTIQKEENRRGLRGPGDREQK